MTKPYALILKEAINKAYKNGYSPKNWKDTELPNSFIFSHDFAKAFWGDCKDVKYLMNNPKRTPFYVWQYHLQQMVLEKEPLKYLEKFL